MLLEHDKLNDELKIPKKYKGQITEIKKYCTKPELEMLLIISEQQEVSFEKIKSSMSLKTFAKEYVVHNRIRYDNSTSFYREYYDERIALLLNAIKRYKHLKGKHQKDELYLAFKSKNFDGHKYESMF